MVSGIGLPIVDYQLAVKNQSQLLSQFQKTPAFSQYQSYYQANIGSVKTPQDLLNNPKLLYVALSAFQLEGEMNATGIIKDLLTQDPTQSTSLAQQLVDPRFAAFAKAFSSLSTDGGATITNPTSVNAVLAGFQNNEYQKWVSTTLNDPTVRQALYFQQQIQDTIDISDAGSLYSQTQQTPGVQQAVSAYKDGIANITSVDGLIGNKQVLNFALQAFNIDPSTVSTSTIRQILTEGTGASDPLVNDDPRFAQFQQAFASLNTDGGVTVQSSTSVNTIVSNYETNQFASAAVSANPLTVSSAFGSNGAGTISTLLADFQTSSGVPQSVSYYQNNIGSIGSASDLVSNPQLLAVALGAFNIDPTSISTAVATQLLTNSSTAPASVQQEATTLLQGNANVASFVQAFSSLGQNGGSGFSQIKSLYQQFQLQPSVQQAVTSFTNNIAGVASVAKLVNNPQLLNFALQAFNIDPTTVSPSTVSRILTESPAAQATDPLLTSDPRMAQFVDAFGSLNTDGGTELHTQSSISAITNAYQANLFAQTLAANNSQVNAQDFADGSVTVTSLTKNFLQGSGVGQAATYYQNNIGGVTSVGDLVGNSQLLNVALGAFNVDPSSVTASTLTSLLTETPAEQASDPALTSNPRLAQFVQAFSSLSTDDGVQTRSASSVASITSAYQANQFQQSIAAKTQELIANPTLGTLAPSITSTQGIAAIVSAYQTNQFQQSLAAKAQEVTATPALGTISTLQILGNATLSAVTLGALGLPAQVGALSVDQQQQALTRAGFNPSKLTDPKYLNTFINQFLANAGQQSGATGTSAADVALAALEGSNNSGSSDPIPIDLSVLAIDTGSTNGIGIGGTTSSNINGSLVNLFT